MTAPIEVRYGVATDKGLRREINEDSYFASEPLFLVADGMGGHEAGEVASAAVIEEFASLRGRESLGVVELENVFARASKRVRELPTSGGRGAGTTLTGVALSEHDGSAYWLMINLGDSRTYRLADGELEQVSVDHSVVQELIDAGSLTAEQAGTDSRKNVITKAIGAGNSGHPDYWMIPAAVGDRILICSDGLTGEVPDDKLHDALTSDTDPQAVATRLVHEALLHGGRDNVTVLVVDALWTIGTDSEKTQPLTLAPDFDDTVPRLTPEPFRVPGVNKK